MEYTELSEEMYQHAVEKIRYQLESQVFNIADFQKWRGPLFLLRTPFIPTRN